MHNVPKVIMDSFSATAAEKNQAALDYLGSCHAATIEHEGSLSRTSRSTRRRYARIGETFLRFMTPGSPEAQRLQTALDALSSMEKSRNERHTK